MELEPLRPLGAEVGRIDRFADAEDRYVVHLLTSLPHRLDGLKVVLDCAHGAAAGCSPQAFTDAGAEVVVIGADPDGLNINDGVGSTHLEPLQAAVLEHGADFGIAMTATLTAAWPWTPPAPWWTATRSWGSWRWP